LEQGWKTKRENNDALAIGIEAVRDFGTVASPTNPS
jgi:hypothetical protein